MENILLRHIHNIYMKWYVARHPIEYVKKIGVQLKGSVYFYTSPLGMFGSEPWMITIGDNVYITDGVRFITHDGGTLPLRQEVPDLEITKPIVLGDNIFIGVRSIILPGVHIGNRCIVAAGAVVAKDIPDNSVAGGVPARVIKSTDEYLEKLQKESLHIGHLKGEEKAKRLKEIYNITHI